jgi:pentatricopeptide repeat protein
MKLSLWLDRQYKYLKKARMFKNKFVEAAMRLMFYGSSIIDMYAKSRMIIDDACRVLDMMHVHIM